MSDWSTAWSGFREGMQIGNQRRAQKEAQQIERDRLKLEQERRQDEMATSEIQRQLLKKKLSPPEFKTPQGMKPTSMRVGPDGEVVQEFSPVVDPSQYKSVDISGPDGKSRGTVLVDPSGKTVDFQRNNPWLERFFPKPAISAPAAESSGNIQPGTEDMPPGYSGLPPVNLPTSRVGGISSPGEGPGADVRDFGGNADAIPQVDPVPVITGVDSHGNPQIEMVYRGSKPRQMKLPNGDTTWVTTDPKTGMPVYSTPKREGTPVSQDAQKRLDTMMLLLDNTPRLADTTAKHKDAGGRLQSKFGRLWGRVWESPTAQLDFDQAKAQMVALMAKGLLGETGVLSEADMKRYTPMIPAYEDTHGERLRKLDKLATLLRDSAKNQIEVLKVSGVDTSQLEPMLAAKIKALGSLGAMPVRVRSEAERRQLPAGTQYTDDSGQVKIKQ